MVGTQPLGPGAPSPARDQRNQRCQAKLPRQEQRDARYSGHGEHRGSHRLHRNQGLAVQAGSVRRFLGCTVNHQVVLLKKARDRRIRIA